PMSAQREPLSEPPSPFTTATPSPGDFCRARPRRRSKKKLRVERRAPRVKVSHGRCRHVIAGEASSSSA
ncbi:hypothetical protein COCCADRAFT_106983, partial [Bipolaris zeicola 26-R-13]